MRKTFSLGRPSHSEMMKKSKNEKRGTLSIVIMERQRPVCTHCRLAVARSFIQILRHMMDRGACIFHIEASRGPSEAVCL